jgi:hypothetical protein
MRQMKVVLLFALTPAVCAVACGPVREAVLVVSPGVPPAEGCTPVSAMRCQDVLAQDGHTVTGRVPATCSASGRWWPNMPGACPTACVMDEDGTARCARFVDGGSR